MRSPRPQRQISSLAFATLMCALVSLGCYKYAPATFETIPVGSDVRAMLSTTAQEELRDRTGMNTAEIEGELVEKGDRVLISVKAAEGSRMLGNDDLYQWIDVPRQGVVRLDVRQVDAVRTGGLVAALAGASVVVLRQAFGGSDPDRPDPGGGPDDSIVGWVLRFPIFRF